MQQLVMYYVVFAVLHTLKSVLIAVLDIIIDHSLTLRHQLKNYHKTCRSIPQLEGKMIKNVPPC